MLQKPGFFCLNISYQNKARQSFIKHWSLLEGQNTVRENINLELIFKAWHTFQKMLTHHRLLGMPFLAMKKKFKKILYTESTFHVLHYEQKELHSKLGNGYRKRLLFRLKKMWSSYISDWSIWSGVELGHRLERRIKLHLPGKAAGVLGL